MNTHKEVLNPAYEAIIDASAIGKGLSRREKEALVDRILNAPCMDITCDWAFKYVFGNHKDLLIMLLDDILGEDIAEIEYLPNEVPVQSEKDKRALLDVLCRTADGRRFLVEMQNAREQDFKDRMFYYGCELVRGQVARGMAMYRLDPVYVICLMNFELRHPAAPADKLVFQYRFLEQETREPFGGQLALWLLELPRLHKSVEHLSGPVEEWLFIIRNLRTFAQSPGAWKSRFRPLLEAARLGEVTEQTKEQYLRAMLTEHDRLAISAAYYEDGLRDGIEKGREEGLEKGRAEGREEGREEERAKNRAAIAEITARLSAMGMSPEQIRDIIGTDDLAQKKG